MTHPLTLSGLCLVLLAASPAAAQTAQERVPREDRTAVSACLRGDGSPAACIGTVAVECLRSGRAGREIECARREEAVWRERMDAGLRVLGQRLDSGKRGRFAALQRTWEGYAAQKCALMSEMQTPARAGATQAACDLREVALRSVEIERMARQERRPQAARPQIYR